MCWSADDSYECASLNRNRTPNTDDDCGANAIKPWQHHKISKFWIFSQILFLIPPPCHPLDASALIINFFFSTELARRIFLLANATTAENNATA